jgi:hypothetical protein
VRAHNLCAAAVTIITALLALVRALLRSRSHSKQSALDPQRTAATRATSAATSERAAATTAEIEHSGDNREATAAAASTLAAEAMSVMLQQQHLPQELWCVNKSVHAKVKHAAPVNVRITADTPTATALAVLLRNAVQHVHISGFDMPEMTVRVLQSAIARHSWPLIKHNKLAQWQRTQSVSFTDMDPDIVERIVEALSPDVHTISVALAQPDVAVYGKFRCTDSIKTLHLKNVPYGASFRLLARQPQLTTLTYEGIGTYCLDLPDSVRSVTFKHVVAPCTQAFVPDLLHGITHVDMSESDITDQYSVPAIPDTVTHLMLPAEYTHDIGNLPSQLEVLDTGYKYNKALGVLPPTLRELYIRRRADDTQQYEHELGDLPDNLEVVHVANMTHSLGGLPNSLKVLKIDGSNFNHSLVTLPDGLVELDLSTAVDFQQPLGILPQSLQTIKLHSGYAHIDAVRASNTAVVVIVTPTTTGADTAGIADSGNKWLRRAALSVATAVVSKALLYAARELLISYMLRSI